ncbi:MAG TPA: hypothetical protein VKT31_08105 [Solirubrobacteraceae bacterium]|nr:hypothetical protein [Solirubrobacteraceae bacterium]
MKITMPTTGAKVQQRVELAPAFAQVVGHAAGAGAHVDEDQAQGEDRAEQREGVEGGAGDLLEHDRQDQREAAQAEDRDGRRLVRAMCAPERLGQQPGSGEREQDP